MHYSDCSLHNAPAYEPGPCDCGKCWGRWTSVKDALPPDDRKYLIVTDYASTLLVAYYDAGCEHWGSLMDEEIYYATHWRPLPSPPAKS